MMMAIGPRCIVAGDEFRGDSTTLPERFGDAFAIVTGGGALPLLHAETEAMLASTTEEYRAAIRGVIDSEHIFRLFLSQHGQQPENLLLEVVRDGVRQVVAWCREIDRDAEIGLNIIMTDGMALIGTR